MSYKKQCNKLKEEEIAKRILDELLTSKGNFDTNNLATRTGYPLRIILRYIDPDMKKFIHDKDFSYACLLPENEIKLDLSNVSLGKHNGEVGYYVHISRVALLEKAAEDRGLCLVISKDGKIIIDEDKKSYKRFDNSFSSEEYENDHEFHDFERFQDSMQERGGTSF